jgi:hypothetical protein
MRKRMSVPEIFFHIDNLKLITLIQKRIRERALFFVKYNLLTAKLYDFVSWKIIAKHLRNVNEKYLMTFLKNRL